MIKILLFAGLQESIGKDTLELNLEEASVRDLKWKLKEQYPSSNLDDVMTAINEEYALDTDIVKQGDTVAFIPPVSGG